MIYDEDEALGEYDTDRWSIWLSLREAHFFWWGIFRTYWSIGGLTRPQSLVSLERDHSSDFAQAELLREVALRLSLNHSESETQMVVTENQQKKLRRTLREFAKHPVVRDRIAFDLAAASLDRMSGAENRVARLAGLVHGRGLGTIASQYVTKATMLYVAGFETEAAILCGSALEGALAEACKGWYDEDNRTPSLDELLKIVGERQLLDGYIATKSRRGWRPRENSELWQADQLRILGNHLIHEDPSWRTNPTGLIDAFEAIRELSHVIGWLFPAPTFE
jgi:hypothetical protein